MIGVFDSGVGGLSVVSEIRKLIPQAAIVYFADSAHVPYGEKSPEFILERSQKISRFLLQQGAKILVIACNTATAAAADMLREELTVPVVAVEPPVKPAVAVSTSKIIGVIATEVTLASERFKSLIDRYAQQAELYLRTSNDLVTLVEAGDFTSQGVKNQIQSIVDDFLLKRVDVVVSGSTHFYFLADLIRELSKGQIQCLAPSEPIARQVQRVANEQKITFTDNLPDQIYVSADPEAFSLKLKKFSDFQTQAVVPELAKI